MKILNFIVILLSLSTFTGVGYAAIPLESDNQILGSWKLDTTKQSATSSELIEREDTWTFKNGTVTITNIPRDGGHYDQSPVKYVIEDGKLKVSVLGRAGKFDIFSLEERSENNMILKAKYGNIYQFTKK